MGWKQGVQWEANKVESSPQGGPQEGGMASPPALDGLGKCVWGVDWCGGAMRGWAGLLSAGEAQKGQAWGRAEGGGRAWTSFVGGTRLPRGGGRDDQAQQGEALHGPGLERGGARGERGRRSSSYEA
jgi:hypothetical protein